VTPARPDRLQSPPATGTDSSGLRNPDGACHLNSLLQCLRACPELRRQATSLSVRDDSPLCAQLAGTLIEMGGAAGTVDTRGLRQALPPGSVGSSSTRQGDVAELWRTMIWGEAQRELEGAGLSRLLPDIFRGTRRTTVTCGRCNRRSPVVDTFSEWVPRAGATRDKREDDRLTGCSRYYCERCHAWSNAGRTVEIVEAPQILAITLERYSISGGRVRRLDGRFTFPLDALDLTELVCSQQGRRRTIYEPLAIIVHSGSVDSGHYHALVREAGKRAAEAARREIALEREVWVDGECRGGRRKGEGDCRPPPFAHLDAFA